MLQSLKALIVFVGIFCLTAYGYYFYHDEMAQLYLRYGVIMIPIFVVTLLLVSLVIGVVTGIPIFKDKRKVVVTPLPTPAKLAIPQLLLGVLVGLIFLVPVLVLLIWVLRL